MIWDTFREYLIFIVLLFLIVFGVIASTVNYEDENEDKGRIMVYSTLLSPNLKYNKNWFNDDLPRMLTEQGYFVNVTDRMDTPEITSSLLSNYDQIWIITTHPGDGGCFSPLELNNIFSFRNKGNGLFIMTDHDEFHETANQIAIPLGLEFNRTVNHSIEGELYEPEFKKHPIANNVTTIVSGHDEGAFNVTGSPEIIATYEGDNIIAVLDDGLGKVVFDVAFPRLYDDGITGKNWSTTGNTSQYIINIADWLIDFEVDYTVELLSILIIMSIFFVIFKRKK